MSGEASQILLLTFFFFYPFYGLHVIIPHINTSLLIALVVGVTYVLPFGSMLAIVTDLLYRR